MAFEKSPREIFVTFTKDKTLSCEASLNMPRWNDGEGEPPLKVVDGRYSGFRMTIVDRTAGGTGKASSALIDCDLNYFPFVGKIESALTKACDAVVTEEGEKAAEALPRTPAYTQRLAVKPFEGRTPAEVLTESAENKAQLCEAYKFLRANLEKYRNNQYQMDAIQEACKLLNEGKLVRAEMSDAGKRKIFGITKAVPYVKDANGVSRKAKDGEIVPCVELNVYFWMTNRNPFIVEIINYDAAITVHENGQVNANPSRMVKESYISNQIFLSWEVMKNLIEKMKHIYDAFFFSHYPEALQMASNISAKRRDLKTSEKDGEFRDCPEGFPKQ